jgi:hypothetical protein
MIRRRVSNPALHSASCNFNLAQPIGCDDYLSLLDLAFGDEGSEDMADELGLAWRTG